MYLLFPDQQVFHFAISGGLIPNALAAAPCQAVELQDGSLLIKASKRDFPRAALQKLSDLQVQLSRFAPSRETLTNYCCWLELIPLETGNRNWESDANVSVSTLLFHDWPALAAASQEVLRLGNDRQSMRSFRLDDLELHLLRIADPPLYSLLAFAEQEQVIVLHPAGSNVWMQANATHPLSDRIAAPVNEELLISERFGWLTISDAPFVDLYECADFPLSQHAARCPVEDHVGRITTTLRLCADSNPDPATLWVIRGDGVQQLHDFVETTDDELVDQLAFAVARDPEGNEIVILRTRGDQRRVFGLPGEGYRSYLRIPNLFVPLGRRLQPPLRRDAAAKALAPDASSVVWLVKHERGFQPQQVDDDAFRPLADWVDYVIEFEGESLEGWIDSHRFSFDAFICDDDAPPAQHRARGADGDSREGIRSSKRIVEQDATGNEAVDEPTAAPLKPVDSESLAPTQLRQELRETERAFLQRDDALDSELRIALWTKMGELQSRLDDDLQAGLCFSNAVWSGDREGSNSRAEWRASLRHSASLVESLQQVNSPTQAARLMGLVASANDEDASFIAAHIGEISQRVEELEPQTSLRVVWLVWLAIARVSGGDALALSRARDRMLGRLYEDGLRADVDLPLFLRNAEVDQERYVQVRDFLHQFSSKVSDWIDRQSSLSDSPSTQLFANLCIAFGMARIGERDLDDLLNSEPQRKDPASVWVRRVFRLRIEQVMRGEPCNPPLPEKLLSELDAPRFRASAGQMRQNHRYLVDRLRSESQILEPQSHVDPYRHITMQTNVKWRQLCLEMRETRDPTELRAAIKSLLAETRGMRETQPYCRAVAACLEIAPRADEETAEQLLRLTPKAISKCQEKGDIAGIIKHGLYLSGHFELDNHVRRLLASFRKHLLEPSDVASRKALDETLFECFDGLRRLGLRREIELLLDRLMDVTEQLAKPNRGESVSVDSIQDVRMKLLLHAASGRFYFGRIREAERVLDLVREVMLTGGLSGQSRGRGILVMMAHRYVQALRHAPIQIVIQRINDLLMNLRGVFDNYTTTVLYSRSQLTFIEQCVLVLVSDDVALSTGGRKWLDDDEYLVRKRIHADVRAALGGSKERQ